MKKLLVILLVLLSYSCSDKTTPKENRFSVIMIEKVDDSSDKYTLHNRSHNKWDNNSYIYLVDSKNKYKIGDVLSLQKLQ